MDTVQIIELLDWLIFGKQENFPSDPANPTSESCLIGIAVLGDIRNGFVSRKKGYGCCIFLYCFRKLMVEKLTGQGGRQTDKKILCLNQAIFLFTFKLLIAISYHKLFCRNS